MIKKALLTQMTDSITDLEKQKASQAISVFTLANKKLNDAKNFLDKIKTPFKDAQDIPPEQVYENRLYLRNFRDQAIEKFNLFKEQTAIAIEIMSPFSTDTQILNLLNSLDTAISGLEEKVNNLSELFMDLKDKEFSKNVVDVTNKIQEDCDSIEELLKTRIKKYINENILSLSWSSSFKTNKTDDKISILQKINDALKNTK